MEDSERERVISEQLQQADENFEDRVGLSSLKDALAQIRGKYSFVQTSVDKFIQRKHEDVEREDSQCHQF